MINNKAAIVAAAVLLPLSANAYEFMSEEPSNFSYNYADAYFVDNDFDSGFLFAGSYDINNSVAVIGSYLTAGDFTEIKVGAAHHAKAGFLKNSDLVLHASYISVEYDFNFLGFDFGIDDSGFAAGATLRHKLQDKLEVFGDVTYTTVFDGDIQFTGGVEWSFSDKLSVRGSYTLADLDTIAIGARYYFK